MAGAHEQHQDPMELLRGNSRVLTRARQWLAEWRAASGRPWSDTESSAMIANAVELSALTELVAMTRSGTDTTTETMD